MIPAGSPRRRGAAGKKTRVLEAANIGEWRGHDVVDAGSQDRHRLVFVPLG
jgi:hypothetical protein